MAFLLQIQWRRAPAPRQKTVVVLVRRKVHITNDINEEELRQSGNFIFKASPTNIAYLLSSINPSNVKLKSNSPAILQFSILKVPSYQNKKLVANSVFNQGNLEYIVFKKIG